MFALEIEFHDGISTPETVLIRRTSAIIGSSEQAHVVIEGIPPNVGELRIVRGIGREFLCQPIRRPGSESGSIPFLEGSYRGSAELKLGEVTLHLTALDLDLCSVPDESQEKALQRVVRRALRAPSPVFPALAVHGPQPVILSFPPDQPILIGRSRKCGLRLDASDVSSEHARVGVENDRVWVEDLGSTNGTYVNDERASGRRYVNEGEVIKIGSEFVVSVLMTPSDVADLGVQRGQAIASAPVEEPVYPCVVSTSDLVKPSRLAIGGIGQIKIGRDPANDIWINAPHVSRQHLIIDCNDGAITVTDHSSNGTFLWGDRLPNDEAFPLEDDLAVLDFCSGVTLAICRTEAGEEAFLRQGATRIPKKDTESKTFNEDETNLSEYRGAQTGGKLNSWGDFVESNDREQERPPSVFEKLVERHGNPALNEEPLSSEDVVEEAVEEEEVSASINDIPQPERFDPSHTQQFQRLSGVMEDETQSPPEDLSSEEMEEIEEDAAPMQQEALESDVLLLPEGYEGYEFEAPRGNSILRIVLIGLVVLMVGFCLMLIFGFFSDNYFY